MLHTFYAFMTSSFFTNNHLDLIFRLKTLVFTDMLLILNDKVQFVKKINRIHVSLKTLFFLNQFFIGEW